MRRVVAVLGAVLMVIVAILVRGALDGDDDSGSDGSSSEGGGDGITLVCIDELESTCTALLDAGEIAGFDTEPAGDTIDRLAEEGADLGADGWLTLEPFPGIAGVARDQAGLRPYFTGSDELGWSTAIDIVAAASRTDALAEACDDHVEWPCLGDLVGDLWDAHGGETSWQEIEIGIDGPQSASGLLTAAQAVAAHLDLDEFATNDLDNSDAVRWLSDFSTGDDVLTRMVTQPGSFSAVGSFDVEARDLAGTPRGEGLGIFYPSPMFRPEVVLARPVGSDHDLSGDAVDDVFRELGWDDESGSTLPSPGALFALREDLS